MSTCVVCTKPAFHCEESNPTLKFCDSKCQFLHYALIGAGKREREEEVPLEEDPQNPIPGFDFTEIVDADVLALIFAKFDYFKDLVNAALSHQSLRNVFVDPRFQTYFLSDETRKKDFEDYIWGIATRSNKPAPGILSFWHDHMTPLQLLTIAAMNGNLAAVKLAFRKIQSGTIPLKDHQANGALNWAMLAGSTAIIDFMHITLQIDSDRMVIVLMDRFFSKSIEIIKYVLQKYIKSIGFQHVQKFVDKNKKREFFEWTAVAYPYFVVTSKITLIKSLFQYYVPSSFYETVKPEVYVLLEAIDGFYAIESFRLDNYTPLNDYAGVHLRAKHLEIFLLKSGELIPEIIPLFKKILDNKLLKEENYIAIFTRLLSSYRNGGKSVHPEREELLTYMLTRNYINPHVDDDRFLRVGGKHVVELLQPYL